MERASGILLPIFSLPSEGGIGTFGRAAYDFIDFLHDAGQRYWQILPLGPTSYGDSPYQPFSVYAGNPYFIDPGLLREDGLILQSEIDALTPRGDPDAVDYAAIYQTRFDLLRLAYERGKERDAEAFARFYAQNADWLLDYALFMALKKHFGMRAWLHWEDEDIRRRRPEALAHYCALLWDEIDFHAYLQFLFFAQWAALRAYARERGVRIMGDMPIYVALDSADVWVHPELFQLDGNLLPVAVAGVPPDYFSATGQLWGNPLYRYDVMEADGFSWWRTRIAGAARLYDTLRIDHFRGLDTYWAVPFGEATAVHGRWVKGPGLALVEALRKAAPELEFVAEDLGALNEDVKKLLADSGFPGMKVLEFAFDAQGPNAYLPHAYERNCICYIGTHDNAPVMAWRDEAAPETVATAVEYLGLSEAEGFHMGMIRGGMASVAVLFIAQMQDCLGLNASARINEPSTLGHNWRWRLLPGQCTPELAKKLRRMSYLCGRTLLP